MGPFTVLAKWSLVLDQSFENVCHCVEILVLRRKYKNFKITNLLEDVYKMRICEAAHSHTFALQKIAI